MKKWIVVLIVALVVPNLYAVDLLIGGAYYDGHDNSLWTDGYSGNIQARVPLAQNLDLGLGLGYVRYNLEGTAGKTGHCRKSSTYATGGNVKAIPVDLSGIYSIPIGTCKLELEAGASYNFVTDTDVKTTTKSRRRTTYLDTDLGDFWLCHLGANVVIPIGMPSIVLGGGYQWDLGRTDFGSNTNNTEGAFCKVGLMLPI